MKTLYLLTTSIMNGTVTMNKLSSAFTDKTLAEKTMKVVDEANKREEDDPIHLTTWSNIEEMILYENEEEVPILNQQNLQ